MTKAEIVQEVIDRGYNYVGQGRIGTFVQRSYRTVCAARSWPFLIETTSGTAPLSLPDLREVFSVKDTTNEAQPRGVRREWLVAHSPNLTDTGTPQFWYLDDEALKLYPVDEAVELEVRYKKRPALLADSDTPLIPEEWQYLIVDLAVAHCLRDDDEYEEARALEADVKAVIREEMAPDLLGRNKQNPDFVERTGRVCDYL